MDEPTIADPEVADAYRALSGTLERLVACVDGLDAAGLNWRPPVAEGNSLTVLIVHTLANVEENILEILGGEPVGRNREDASCLGEPVGPGEAAAQGSRT